MLSEHTLYVGLALLGIGCVVVIALLLHMLDQYTLDDDDEPPIGFEAGDPSNITNQEDPHAP